MILDFMDQIGRITAADAADILGCSKRTAQLQLQKLKKSNYKIFALSNFIAPIISGFFKSSKFPLPSNLLFGIYYTAPKATYLILPYCRIALYIEICIQMPVDPSIRTAV
jgi:hypothetical protein